jgi:hypothetical protein
MKPTMSCNTRHNWWQRATCSASASTSMRMMVALVAHEGWEVHHMDVKNTFLNDVIKEEVYV